MTATVSVPPWSAGASGLAAPAGRVRPAAAGLFSARSWAELLYCVVGLVPAVFFFATTVTLLAAGLGLTVVYLGLPLLMLSVLVARVGGAVRRGLARSLLDLPVAAPAPLRRGPRGRLRSVIFDPVGRRAMAYHCLDLVLAPVRFGLAVGLYAGGLGGLTYPVWRLWLPLQTAGDGSRHRGHVWLPDHVVDTAPTMAAQAVVALALLIAAPRVVRLLTTLDRVLVAALLGPASR